MRPNTLTTQKTKEKTQLDKQETLLLARCSQPLSTNQTPHPTTKRGDNTPQQGVVSGPNSVPAVLPPPPTGGPGNVVARTQPAPTTDVGLHTAHTPPTGVFFVVLLRKE